MATGSRERDGNIGNLIAAGGVTELRDGTGRCQFWCGWRRDAPDAAALVDLWWGN